MHHPKGFPSRLVRLRANAGMTQKELAKASGISVPQIGRYETGLSAPRMTALVKLARALGVEVSAFDNAEQEPETTEFTVVTEGHPDETITLPRSLVSTLNEDADSLGISLEAMLISTIGFAKERQAGGTRSFAEIVKETLDYLESQPPVK
ncbi:helix-turn-helix domain-containing protein [Pseudomonas chlororaphis]|uniref:helix-turn-helix domain-containing protein n=1 Tax=Pseudomonas chlororaphis TaxID=587753 RepID=UPI002366BACE|nr:helix-turn-helix transcriptional regulator [Pseudomonas chlororaphis]WDH25074.1 helix-turn-helix transcriptional regulator [Pseudomonas chlororaphis]